MADCKGLPIDALVTAAVQTNHVIIGGAVLCGTIVGLRVVNRDELKVWDIPLKISYFPLLAVALTVAHAYCGGLIQLRVDQLLALHDADLKRCAWQTLTTNGPLIFQGMEPRVLIRSLQVPVIGSLNVYTFVQTDYTTKLLFLMAASVIAGIVASSVDFDVANRGRWHAWRKLLLIFIFAVAVGLANWTIGSAWAIAVSRLMA
ncbi:hypothetical protein IC762_22785 [Bradyrhizobium genosp. L]|uniref:hypothetical protein n=1 Tax=Bradyrhizobium genosp. L TaxID=83637 RepID=UPI0018A2B072|nr:hypothetical protein [Bradyrhizobium genosp. L]QPF82571.1 hypothetical protein IC762_22785 [Bradyrhizobium genosp. L]